jgi:DNA polymerase-3 subunit epsilon
MLLFIDTETSGLPDFTLPLIHPSQPRVVQLAAWLGEWEEKVQMLDEELGIVTHELRHHASLNAIIRPAPGATIHPRAEAVHGISLERARAVGEDLGDVLRRLYELVTLASADPTSTLVAHNLPFDNNMLLIESAHAGFDPTPLSYLRPFCTMRALTDRMRLPGRFPGKYKWPNLAEAHRFCLGRDFDDSHSAMGDVLACRDIYIHGRTEGWWP